jgi:hypothetical protein
MSKGTGSPKRTQSKKPRAAKNKPLPLWAQLRKAYEFATPQERAAFDAMARAVMKRDEVSGQSLCPHDCTAFQNPLHT